MTILEDYTQFDGLHWETGTVRNFLAYRGVTAPHTGRPYSEALLLGISGGAVMGYFTFAYEGYDPMARILTRNTFDPWERMLSRLGVAQDVRQTTGAAKGVANLRETLADGLPAIVWADMWSLPYNALTYDAGMWGMMPILVYGYNEDGDMVRVADRARVGLTVTPAALAEARGRIKKDRQRIVTLGAPDPARLAAAVSAGIRDCIALYSEKPPKGARHNFGLAAYDWWAEQLRNPRARRSWAREFPRGVRLWAGLTSAFSDIRTFGKDSPAERAMYADFLDEAAVILERPALGAAASEFRRSSAAWGVLSEIMLPASDAVLGESGRLILGRHDAFLACGNDARAEMVAADVRLAELRGAAAEAFPLDADAVVGLQGRMAEQLLAIREIEARAVDLMRAAMADS
jgi:hypothetical protein